MAVKKIDLERSPTIAIEKTREELIEEQVLVIERFLDAGLRAGTRIFPFDQTPKISPPLTDKEARDVTAIIKQRYMDNGWKITVESVRADIGIRQMTIGAWSFS